MRKKIEIFFNKIILVLRKPEVRILPGHLAFYFVLSIVPIITLIVFFGSLFNIPSNDLLNFFNKSLPDYISNFLVPSFTDSTISLATFLLLIITFFVASNGAKSIIITSNALYEIKNENSLKIRIKSIIIIFIFIFLFLFMFMIPIFGKHLIEMFYTLVKKDYFMDNILLIYNILQIPISLIFIYFSIKLIYTMAPSKIIKSREVTSGALFTTITWIMVTKIFSYYISNLSNYDKVYGNLSNIIILMFFMYLLSYIFVIGMALNASKKDLEDEIEKTGGIKILKKDIINKKR